MQVSLSQPIGFTSVGTRPTNEDALFPNPGEVTPEQRWFLVCDGVGGAERGEVASQLAAGSFDDYFRTHPVAVVTDDYIQQALSYVQDQFDAYVAAHPSAAGMGTTLTLLYLHDAGATVAHIGDSRVYHLRNGQIQWQTDDHSYVNELVKSGVLSVEEARNHPQRNIITRAIQGGQGSQRAVADVTLIDDLQAGDYFLLCSDGVLERVSDELLEDILSGSDSNEEKLTTLLSCCQGHTRDNFTAYLIQLNAVIDAVLNPELIVEPLPSMRAAGEVSVMSTPVKQPIRLTTPAGAVPSPREEPTLKRALLPMVTGLVVLTGGYLGWQAFSKPKQTTTVAVAELPSKRPPLARSSPQLSSGDSNYDNMNEPSPELTVEREAGWGLFIGKVGEKRGLLNFDKETWLVRPQFDEIGSFRNGIVEVVSNGRTQYVSRNGKIYDEAYPDYCQRIRVKANDQYGYLNLNGTEVIKVRYNRASSFDDNENCTAEVTLNGKTYRIDKKGEPVK